MKKFNEHFFNKLRKEIHNLDDSKAKLCGDILDIWRYQARVMWFLKNRKERVNLNSSFSEWETILTGVPQGSILAPLLFDIFLNDFFLVVTHSQLQSCKQ